MLMAGLQAELCPILFHFLFQYFLSWYLMFGMFCSGPHKGCCQSKLDLAETAESQIFLTECLIKKKNIFILI